MKQLLLISYFSFCWFISSSQTNEIVIEKIQTLKQELSESSSDSSRASILRSLAALYVHVNSDSSIFYGEKGLEISIKTGYFNSQIITMGILSEAYTKRGDLPKAMKIALEAVEIDKKYYKSNESRAGRSIVNIGAIYFDIEDYEKAMLNFRPLTQGQATDGQRVAFGHYHIARVFEKLNLLDSTLYHLQKSFDAFKNINSSSQPYLYEAYPDWYNTRAKLYAKQNKPDLALADYNKSLRLTLKSKEAFHTINTYNDLAEFYKDSGEKDSCIYYAEEAVSAANNISYFRGVLAASHMLAEMHEESDSKKALYYFKLASETQNKLYGAGNIQVIRDIITQNEQKQIELEIAKSDYQNQLIQFILLGGMAALLLIAFILYHNNKKAKQANDVLGKTLDNLKSTQTQLIHSEKMASLGELTAGIAHEIQNPLNFVNNFSEVNRELFDDLETEIKKGNQDEIIAIFKDLRDNEEKIIQHGKRADGIVKSMLQHSRSSTGEKELTDINALCEEYLRLAYHGFRAKDKGFNAKFKTEMDPNLPKINVVSQDIGRVLLNLINNGFQAIAEKAKHRAQYYQPELIVHTKKFDDKIEIWVKDNGPGIHPTIKEKIFQPFFTTKPTGQGTGLGLSLSYDIVKAHGGELTVESKEGMGSEFVVKIPFV